MIICATSYVLDFRPLTFTRSFPPIASVDNRICQLAITDDDILTSFQRPYNPEVSPILTEADLQQSVQSNFYGKDTYILL